MASFAGIESGKQVCSGWAALEYETQSEMRHLKVSWSEICCWSDLFSYL